MSLGSLLGSLPAGADVGRRRDLEKTGLVARDENGHALSATGFRRGCRRALRVLVGLALAGSARPRSPAPYDDELDSIGAGDYGYPPSAPGL